MIDLHCHILPGIDDGSKNLEISLNMLKMQKEQGVDKVMFTPHFKIDEMTYEEFLQKREESKQILLSNEECQKLDMTLKTGSEVYFSLKLLELEDLQPLCFEGSDYMLIEFSTKMKPYGIKEALTSLLGMGYTPILAHVERYGYFAEDPTLLYDLVMDGCLAHINAETLIKNSVRKRTAMKYLKWDLVHFICSDSHSDEHRIPNVKEGYEVVRRAFGEDYVQWLTDNSEKVFNGKDIDLSVVKKPKKFLNFWI